MAKVKTIYVCQSCGHKEPKWSGKCAQCGTWNSFVEEHVSGGGSNVKQVMTSQKPVPIAAIESSDRQRINLNDTEVNRVLGGGLIPGSLVLCAGEPGIGKSTLWLQVALRVKDKKVLYISGEESEEQIKLRAERIGIDNSQCILFTSTNLEVVMKVIKEESPDICIIDSIQTLHSDMLESAPGSVGQIRECATQLMRFAKETGIPVLIIGHITKDGHIAGPKVLEHMVDVVLQFEGDRNHLYRILRATKNRFGSTQELGIYEMHSAGLREILNPSEVLMGKRDEELSGIAIAAMMEGMRPMLVEVQALVSSAAYGTPQRSSTGFDLRRLSMLLAVLEKKCGMRLGNKDVFLNIAGGIRVDDPAIDLAVICAILSSNIDKPIPSATCFAAEVGLSGEIRPVSRIEQRITEAEKLGFDRILISKYSTRFEYKGSIELVKVARVEDVMEPLFL